MWSPRSRETTVSAKSPRAAYIHIPFCRAKCFYCDFNSYPGQESMFDGYVAALTREIRSATGGEEGLTSVYFGGGTPTSLPTGGLVGILRALSEHIGISEDAEVTIEANPGTVDAAILGELKRGGFNRLSIGVQSFSDAILERLGRIHTADEARTAYRLAREAGFENISIDLMYSLPDQSLDDWKSTLAAAIDLRPEHISLYELTVEEGTHFGNLLSRCLITLPDEDMQIGMYRAAIDSLTAQGYEHYEISNFALPGRRSRHNQVYWRNDPYYGFGAGAAAYVDGVRRTNIAQPVEYIEAMKSGSAVATTETVSVRQSMGETIMLGLRMLDGVDTIAFEERYGVEITEAYPSEIADLTQRGLIELCGGRMRLTADGLLVANEAAVEFV